MTTFKYRYVDAYEIVEGEIEAPCITSAALHVLQDDGSEPGRPRWQRYTIRERAVTAAPDDVEFVHYHRYGNGTYDLTLKKVGSRKRKPLRIFA